MRKTTLVLTLCLLSALNGCATMAKFCLQQARTTTTVSFTSAPPGALGVSTNGRTFRTPETVVLRNEYPVAFTFIKDGCEPRQVVLRRRFNPVCWLNLFNGGLGLVVDLLTGSATKLDPSDVHLVFESPEGPVDSPDTSSAEEEQGMAGWFSDDI